MKMKRAWVVAIGLCAGHGIAASQPVAEKPDWKVGDRWEFRQTTTPGDQSTTWSRQITELLPENRIRVKFGNGTLEALGSLNHSNVGTGGQTSTGHEWRGHVDASGIWDLDETYRTGF